MKKIILHLCADLGSDSQPYADSGYSVVKVGKNVGVENYIPPSNVYDIITNPVCAEFARFQVDDAMSFRSLCSQNFAQAFFNANK